jgi:hypothetical protein
MDTRNTQKASQRNVRFLVARPPARTKAKSIQQFTDHHPSSFNLSTLHPKRSDTIAQFPNKNAIRHCVDTTTGLKVRQNKVSLHPSSEQWEDGECISTYEQPNLLILGDKKSAARRFELPSCPYFYLHIICTKCFLRYRHAHHPSTRLQSH